MTPSSSGQHLKRNLNIQPTKNLPDKIKLSKKPPTRIKSKERQQTAIQVDVGNVHRDNKRLGENRRPKIIRIEKPRQEICAPLKWFCFFINFCIFLVSVGCLALGLYLFVNAPRSISEPADVLLNPAVLLASIGLISGFVSIFGMFGALRDNVFLLKLFALCVFFGYLLLFYSDVSGESSTFISIQSVLLHSIARYHSNKNYADFIDYLQEQLECCGSTTFHDWQFSEQFKCNASNPYPERCGVPYSCCRKSVVSRAGAGEVNPLTPAIRSIQCWQNAQKKREQELDSDIYVLGCLQPLRTLFDSHALHIGMIVLSIIFPVCVTVCLSQCLARQIDYQHFLLRREQRRIARNERREKRYLEQKGEIKIGKQHKRQTTENAQKQGEKAEVIVPPNKCSPPRSPPKVKPPPTPKNDEEAAQLGTSIKAGKLEWKIGKTGRKAKKESSSRASSFSPLRNLSIKNNKKCEGKRKSSTLESVPNNKIKKRVFDGKKEQQHPSHKNNNFEKLNNKNCSKNIQPEPSAPPMYFTMQLQQHHFN
uniref:Uncharacterized protein n=1 Tax=Meloidogyne enterolobii TaxID=390850 RepID=A0A6V7UG12_MELEN|nr:unnamed protein product [Meloidogyne enterolobii]